MKLSIAWIFDHIDADWKKLDMPALVQLFNKTAAEIEGVEKISLDLKNFALAQIVSTDSEKCSVEISEWKKKIELPIRDDKSGFALESFLVKKEKDNYRWAKLTDFFCGKDGLLPAMLVQEDLVAGGWKKDFQAEDYILEVDNKTITHRPDMWSHCGFAREIAAMLNLPFKPFERAGKKEIEAYDNLAPVSEKNPIEISLKDQTVGKRFAGLYLESADKKTLNRPSLLWMAYRLACTGNRPINFLVDATNYVMLDLGQPMHVFDAAGLKKIEGRLARKGEKLTLLDDQEIELTPEDYVITDGKKPISLAGVMGGKDSGVLPGSSAIFLESANFDATTVRRTAARFKTRTEASARFEKTLDPNQNVDAIIRFLDLLDQESTISYKASEKISSVGKETEPVTVELSHELLCKRLGAQIDPKFVVDALKKIEFSVKQSGDVYKVTIPTFRCSKDVTIPEDIIEEVGRFFGYDNIEHVLPLSKLEASDLSHVMRERVLKNVCAHALRMREVSNYALFDESFLKEINFEPSSWVEIKNPFSSNWRRLVTFLIPNILKNIKQNVADYDSLRFFEFGRAWNLQAKEILEQKRLAGIFFERKKDIDFYESKNLLNQLFEAIDLEVRWEKTEPNALPVWYAAYQTAQLFYKEKQIGFAGKINQALLGSITEGDAFVFELDSDFLISYKAAEKKFKSAGKYPGVHRDVSMLVPLSVTVDQIAQAIGSADSRVHDVQLVDFFQKKEWADKKSITMRFVIQDETKTLTGQEADQVYDQMLKKLEPLGATIR